MHDVWSRECCAGAGLAGAVLGGAGEGGLVDPDRRCESRPSVLDRRDDRFEGHVSRGVFLYQDVSGLKVGEGGGAGAAGG